jgi:hypothetical protein
MQAVEIRRYKTEQEYRKDAPRWAKRGYTVAHVAVEPQRAGCGAIFTLGLSALLFKRKSQFLVTYQRQP